MEKKAKNIAEYIKGQPKEVGERLRVINEIIKKTAPKAVEAISYGMPAYKLDGKVLIYYAAHKNHIGLYPFPATLSKFKKDTEKYKTAKGSIQFQNDEKLPTGLITKIVKYRTAEKTKRVCSRGHVFYSPGACLVCWPGRLKVKK